MRRSILLLLLKLKVGLLYPNNGVIIWRDYDVS